MESFTSCAKLSVTDALARLPDAQAQRFATIFEHSSLLVEIYAPRGFDPQKPHSRDELYFVVSGSGEYVCDGVRQPFNPPICSLLQLVLNIVLKTLRMTWSYGLSSMVLREAKPTEENNEWICAGFLAN
ncbi:MAG: hypothetical protein ACRD8U_24400 [Pyrinomonadaceae bacterium]